MHKLIICTFAPRKCRPRSVQECGKRPKTARPGRLHRGAAGSTTTIRSMNLTEERYLPGDEALLDY
jgi:hypothetical protein